MKKPKKKGTGRLAGAISINNGIKDFAEISARNKHLINNYHSNLPEDIVKILDNSIVSRIKLGEVSTIYMAEDMQIVIWNTKPRKFIVRKDKEELIRFVE